jgi:hypothetical protein
VGDLINWGRTSHGGTEEFLNSYPLYNWQPLLLPSLNDNYASGGAVNVGSGTFTMNGGTISGNRVEATSSSSSYDNSYVRANGGGVYVEGTFIMNNGTISGNTAYSAKFPSAGGGVFIGSGGTFTLGNGTISGNTAQSSSVLATS